LNEFQVLESKKPAVFTAGYDFAGGGGGSRTLEKPMITNG
jgi:hypothetical protein